MASRRKTKKSSKKTAVSREAIVTHALDSIDFLYGEATEQDEITIRAMVLKGATVEQIVQAISIAAVNGRVPVEDKSRYAFGVLRNLLEDQNY